MIELILDILLVLILIAILVFEISYAPKNPKQTIKIKYHNDQLEPITKLTIGDWIDLRAAEDVVLEKGESTYISLGVSMKLPDGYEAHVVPRSSTFKNWGIIQTNSCGIIDNSYSGDDDIWKMPVYATRDTVIKTNERIKCIEIC